jgi:hypothetical protein
MNPAGNYQRDLRETYLSEDIPHVLDENDIVIVDTDEVKIRCHTRDLGLTQVSSVKNVELSKQCRLDTHDEQQNKNG